jgi:hypothetical protein
MAAETQGSIGVQLRRLQLLRGGQEGPFTTTPLGVEQMRGLKTQVTLATG